MLKTYAHAQTVDTIGHSLGGKIRVLYELLITEVQ